MAETLTLLVAVGSALTGGAFFAFSAFVMPALGELPAPDGIAAMQSINLAAKDIWFEMPFLGTGLLSLGLAVAAIVGWRLSGCGYLLAGALLYVLGTFFVTVVFNIPRNDVLAQLAPDSTQAAELWADYLVNWTFWNHVRAAAAIAASVSFVLALRKLRDW